MLNENVLKFHMICCCFRDINRIKPKTASILPYESEYAGDISSQTRSAHCIDGAATTIDVICN